MWSYSMSFSLSAQSDTLPPQLVAVMVLGTVLFFSTVAALCCFARSGRATRARRGETGSRTALPLHYPSTSAIRGDFSPQSIPYLADPARTRDPSATLPTRPMHPGGACALPLTPPPSRRIQGASGTPVVHVEDSLRKGSGCFIPTTPLIPPRVHIGDIHRGLMEAVLRRHL
ncbi:hypothetical protein C8Q76DRAFT_250381 [Earliella scabrosa]|nr:hypothetical protein C8Q76DRAFT_250381 [Earliella scabrosa]